MNLGSVYVIDIETNGLLNVVNKLHVMSVGWKDSNGNWQIKSTNKEEDIRRVFENPNNTVVGHFFLGYDIHALKILFPTIDFKTPIIDTLSLSHYLYNDRLKHGLEEWGIEFGFEKVKISDEEWENLSYERATERCERDVLINALLWDKQLSLLRELYEEDDYILSPIKRANFKVRLQHIQENNKIKLDVEKCKSNLEYLENIIAEKVEELKTILPKIPKKSVKSKPKIMFKKGGELSSQGIKWLTLLQNCNLPEDYQGDVEVITGYSEPNPQSSQQIKAYLTSLNWKPKLFKDGANGKVPQIRDDDKKLCSSVMALLKDHPQLEALSGLSVATHRASYLKAFLSTMTEDGYVTASWSGMAKTWRVKHIKPITNLPSNNSEYGELVRSVLIAPEGKVFVNADLSSLEDLTKQACIYKYDPDYVNTLNTPGYDAHLNIAKLGGFMTDDEIAFFRWYKEEDRDIKDLPESFKDFSEEDFSAHYKRLSKVRKSSKVTNYSATYGASARKIAESADISEKEAKALHKAYWDLNWSVKKFAEDLQTKEVDGRTWIYNPFTKLWLILSSDHIRFSACNQNFGACVFDLFLWYLIEAGVKPVMSIHDELSFYIDEGQEGWAKKIIKESMDKVNKAFNLPVTFRSEPEFSKSYGDVH